MALTTWHSTSADFTQAEINEYRRLVTELLATCRRVADEHAPEGEWTAPSDALPAQFSEAMGLIADIARALNQTRKGIRRINNAARMRLPNRPAEHACDPPPP
jgi:hypothetical protein